LHIQANKNHSVANVGWDLPCDPRIGASNVSNLEMIKEHLMDQAMDLSQPLVFDEKDADRKKNQSSEPSSSLSNAEWTMPFSVLPSPIPALNCGATPKNMAVSIPPADIKTICYWKFRRLDSKRSRKGRTQRTGDRCVCLSVI